MYISYSVSMQAKKKKACILSCRLCNFNSVTLYSFFLFLTYFFYLLISHSFTVSHPSSALPFTLLVNSIQGSILYHAAFLPIVFKYSNPLFSCSFSGIHTCYCMFFFKISFSPFLWICLSLLYLLLVKSHEQAQMCAQPKAAAEAAQGSKHKLMCIISGKNDSNNVIPRERHWSD